MQSAILFCHKNLTADPSRQSDHAFKGPTELPLNELTQQITISPITCEPIQSLTRWARAQRAI